MLLNTKDAGGVRQLMPVHEIKALSEKDDTGAFEGYGAVFGNVDVFGEKVMPGAFVQSLVDHKRAGTRVKMFWYHDPREVVGRWVDLAEDKKGLFVKGQLNLKVGRAAELHSLMKDGDVDGLSIGFRVIKGEENNGVFELQQLDLVEISIVSLPANPRATVDEVKTVQHAAKFDAFCKALADGKPPPVKDFEDILREAGVPRSMATRVASVGYAKAIRSDSESAAEAVMQELAAAVASFK